MNTRLTTSLLMTLALNLLIGCKIDVVGHWDPQPWPSASPSESPAPTATPTPTSTPVTNRPPTATSQALSVNEDGAKGILLSGSDPDGDSLSFSISANPLHGSLSGTFPNLIYTPAQNYNGADSFKFKVFDGSSFSEGTIALTIVAVNDAPQANPKAVDAYWNRAETFSVSGSDIEGSALTFMVISAPAHGTVAASGANFVYTPAAEYVGPDSFTFRAFDGQLYSAAQTVSVNVQPPQFHLYSMYGTYGDKVNVKVEGNIAAPVVLALCAYDATQWNLSIAAGTQVKRIYTCGYNAQSVTNAAGIQIVNLNWGYAYSLASVKTLADQLKTSTGLSVSSFQGSYETEDVMFRNVANAPLPANYEVHFVSVYEASSDHTKMMPVEITVDRISPVVLVLSAYESVEWKITAQNNSKIAKVINLGYTGGTVTGAPIGAQAGGYGPYAYTFPSSEASSLINLVTPYIIPSGTLSPTSYQGRYNGNSFLIR